MEINSADICDYGTKTHINCHLNNSLVTVVLLVIVWCIKLLQLHDHSDNQDPLPLCLCLSNLPLPAHPLSAAWCQESMDSGTGKELSFKQIGLGQVITYVWKNEIWLLLHTPKWSSGLNVRPVDGVCVAGGGGSVSGRMTKPCAIWLLGSEAMCSSSVFQREMIEMTRYLSLLHGRCCSYSLLFHVWNSILY